MRKEQQCHLVLVWREASRCADLLAKEAISSSINQVVNIEKTAPLDLTVAGWDALGNETMRRGVSLVVFVSLRFFGSGHPMSKKIPNSELNTSFSS